MKNKLYLSILLFITVILTAIGVIAFRKQSEEVTASNAYFDINNSSGFYEEDISIEIKVPKNAEVYYTEDGSVPARESVNSVLYEEPITLPCYDEITVYTLKFILYLKEEASPVYTYTYVTGPELTKRFDTMVVSITGDEEALFGYDEGVFVEGRLRQEFIEENPDLEEIRVKDPANYNLRGEEGEREVTVQILDADGTDLLSQNCGIRIAGNYTRGKNQKSFQLFPRKKYDENGTFHVTLFPDILRESDGTILDRNNRLLFRNSGDDFNHAFIRDTLIQSLSKQYGYPFAYTDIPAAVFINGQYQGFYWVREPFQSGYLENMYGYTNGDFVTLALNEFETTVVEDKDEEKQSELQEYTEDYQGIYDTFCEAELSDDEVYAELDKLIDVENYLQYYALELYAGNKDWPYNNVKAYRYVSDTDSYIEGTIFDGRYRYLLFDTDYSFYLNDQYTSYSYEEDNIAILSNNAQSPLFSKLMGRKDCRDFFVNTLCDLMNSSFAYENVAATLSELDAMRQNELSHFLQESDKPDDTVSMETVAEEMEVLLEFAENRPDYVHTFIQTDFPVFTPYHVEVDKPETVSLSVNTLENVENGFSGVYYGECGLRLEATADIGHGYPEFYINGHKYAGESLQLSGEELLELLQGTDRLEIRIEVQDGSLEHPVIYSISSKGSDDCIVLYNPTDHEINLKGCFVSDDPEELNKSALPDITLAAGETCTIYGLKNQSEEAAYQSRFQFNLKEGETLYLTNTSGTIVQSVTMPDLQGEDSIYQLDVFGKTFYESR